MDVDILIRGGHVVDPSQGIDGIMDIAVAGGKIVPTPGPSASVEKTVDAAGCYVFPGLVDFHTHSFFGGNENSINPEILPAYGTTATVDAGSATWSNYRQYFLDIVCRTQLKVKSYLCYSNYGVDLRQENYAPEHIDEREIKKIFAAYGKHLLGLKLRLMRGMAESIEPLKRMLRLADELGTGVCVHVTNCPVPVEDVADMLRPGDIFCHIYNGKGDIVVDGGGLVKPAIRRARDRGVLFDMANGRNNFSFKVARAAMQDGFLPDIISTDMTSDKMSYHPCVRDFPYIMAKMLELGMPLDDLVRTITETPAAAMKMAGQIGTLRPGAIGDVAVFRLVDRPSLHSDALGEKLLVNKVFRPEMTVLNGTLAFCQTDFNLYH